MLPYTLKSAKHYHRASFQNEVQENTGLWNTGKIHSRYDQKYRRGTSAARFFPPYIKSENLLFFVNTPIKTANHRA